jgi:hypothetical protein
MHSLNFLVGRSGINVAIDDCWDLTDDLRFMIEAYQQAQEFVKKSNASALFYQYSLCFGQTSGFQIFIASELGQDEFITNALKDWSKQRKFITVNQEVRDLTSLPYFPETTKNLTVYNLRRVLKKEYQNMYNQLIDFANAIGLGLVTKTGNVDYFSDLRKFSARQQAVSSCV